MTKSNITQYDNTAANNTDVEDVPLGENQMYPADVNNAFREVMADLADVNDGTVALTSPSFASATMTGDLSLGDNNKAIFGAGSDLSIYHDGFNSIISENGTGDLDLKTLNGTDITLMSEATNGIETTMARFVGQGSSSFYENGTKRLTTSPTGITVIGGIVTFGGIQTFTDVEVGTSLDVGTNITVGGTVDGRDVATDGTKLDGIEASADVTDATNVTAAGAAMLTGATFTGDVSFGANDKAIFNSGGFGLEVYNDGFNSFFDANSGFVVLSGTQVKLAARGGGETMLKAQTDGAVTLYYDNSARIATTSTGIDVTGSVTADGGAFTGDVTFGDNNKAIFGAGSDLQIFHDGSNSYIDEAGDGVLFVKSSNGIYLNGKTTDESLATFIENGAVTLYHDNSAKISTTATGIDVTGTATADGATFTGVVNINATTGYGNLEMGGPSGAFIDFKTPFSDDKDGRIIYDGSNFVISTSAEQPVILQQNSSTKLNTTATGINVTGTVTADGATFNGDVSLGDNHAILLGDEPNLSISHNATNSVIADVGGGNITLSTNGDQILFYDSLNSRSMFRTATNGRLELFYQGDIKLETKSEGIEVTGSVVSQVGINAQTGTTYTTVLADQSKLVTLTNASAITLTIPANSSVAYPVGTKIDFAQLGAGQVTVAGAGGVTVNATPTLKFRDQYSAASCIKTATDTWLLVGDLEA